MKVFGEQKNLFSGPNISLSNWLREIGGAL